VSISMSSRFRVWDSGLVKGYRIMLDYLREVFMFWFYVEMKESCLLLCSSIIISYTIL
jgi:hypothetical protein